VQVIPAASSVPAHAPCSADVTSARTRSSGAEPARTSLVVADGHSTTRPTIVATTNGASAMARRRRVRVEASPAPWPWL
jgi:hypothetical protein